MYINAVNYIYTYYKQIWNNLNIIKYNSMV